MLLQNVTYFYQASDGGAWGGQARQRSDWNDAKMEDDGEEESWEKQAEELYPADDESGPDPGLRMCNRLAYVMQCLFGLFLFCVCSVCVYRSCSHFFRCYVSF